MSHVDTPSPVTHVSLCAGYGGIDLGLHRAIRNLRTIAVSEIESFACANLVAKMEAGLLDPAPIWTDLKTFPWSDFRDRVDILSGGYPCQPFSAAGKRLGAEDPRHLWPHISAGIALMRPAVCFFENVEGHISLGLPDVIEDLGRLGYRATWCVASASECGAPHQRKRVFILAYDAHGEQRAWSLLRQNWQGSAVSLGCGSGRAEELALTSSIGSAAGLPRPQQGHEGIAGVADHCGDQAWPSRPGEPQHAWEPPRVVVDAKSQRAGQRSELRSEECGSGSALSWDVEQSGEGAVENANELRLEEHGLQHAGVSLGSGRGQDSEAAGVPNAQDMRLEEQSECGQQYQADGSWPSNLSGVCPCEAQEGRSVEHTSDWSNGEQSAEQQGRHSVGGSGEEGAMGNSTSPRCPRPEDTGADCGDESQGTWREESERAGSMGHPNSPRPQERPRQRAAGIQGADADGGETADGEAVAEMGRDPYGALSWSRLSELSGLSDQELAEIRHWMVASDNRTDELRLLGNGVVPACAERAFRLLVSELMEHQP